MCGPRIVPSATTRAKWTPRPESSRMLVNPAETATSASFVARAANTARGVRAISSTLRVRIPMKCPWTSHIPGMSAGTFRVVAPAADGAPSIGPAYAIVAPSTTSAPSLIGSPSPGISTSASIRNIGFAIAGGPKNVAAPRDTENLMGRSPFPRAMAGPALCGGNPRPARRRQGHHRPRLDELEGGSCEPLVHLEDDPRRRRDARELDHPRRGGGRDQQCELHRIHPDAPPRVEGGRRDRERLFRGPSRRADDLPRGERVSLPDRLVGREPAGRRPDGQRNPQLERGVDRLTRVAAAPGPQHAGRRGPAARDRWPLGGG